MARFGVIDIDSGKISELIFAQSDLDDAGDPVRRANGDGDILLPPQMAFLKQHVGDAAGRGADDQPGYLSDISVGGPDRITPPDGHFSAGDGLVGGGLGAPSPSVSQAAVVELVELRERAGESDLLRAGGLDPTRGDSVLRRCG